MSSQSPLSGGFSSSVLGRNIRSESFLLSVWTVQLRKNVFTIFSNTLFIHFTLLDIIIEIFRLFFKNFTSTVDTMEKYTHSFFHTTNERNYIWILDQ